MKNKATPILSVSGLQVHQGESFRLSVPSFSMSSGECMCIFGDSGCGKSTLLDVLALMAPPTNVHAFDFETRDGSISLSEKLSAGELDQVSHLRSSIIGYAPQVGGMLPFLSARQDIRSSIDLAGEKSPDAEQRSLEFAEELRFSADLDKRRSMLSGGQRKRVSILRAISTPRLLYVLDEPTAGLDNSLSVATLKLLKRVAEQDGAACIIASHDIQIAANAGFQTRELCACQSGSHRESFLWAKAA